MHRLVRIALFMLIACLVPATIVPPVLANMAMSLSVNPQTYANKRLGIIAAKGRVLGPNGAPIWAEYDEKGQVVKEIGEAFKEPLKSADVISAQAYRSYVQAYQAVQDEFGPVSRVIGRAEYENTLFKGPDDNILFKPGLGAMTVAVVIRDPNTVYGTMNLLLHESILDLQRLDLIADSTRSVLLSREGRVLAVSDVNIGYRTAFYTPRGSTEHETVGGAPLGKDSLGGFVWQDDQLWGPISGAEITTGTSKVWSDVSGHFDAFRSTSCDMATSVWAKLRYQDFDPQGPYAGQYIMIYHWDPDCYWVPMCIEPPSMGPTLNNMLLYQEWMQSCFSSPGGLYVSPTNIPGVDSYSRIKFHVDVAMVSGKARLRNPNGMAVPTEQDTQYAYVPPATDPSYTVAGRVADTPPDFSHQGLLNGISQQDLEKTDVYIFRVSNDQLITSRKGLSGHDWIPDYDAQEKDGEIQFQMLIRGPTSGGDELSRKRSDLWKFENYQKATHINPELQGFQADHLRIGEKVKVVVVNRATGYIGTAEGSYGASSADSQIYSADSTIQILLPSFDMGPPNLRIMAERAFTPSQGLTAGEQKTNLIGFEGAGLTSDKFVRVTTEWYDHDGTPLPAELPGFTGRLAKVVAPDTLAPATQVATEDGSDVANFEIKPGRHTQLVQLPCEQLDDAHFYIHVNGEPPEGNPDFSEGASEYGPLKYRPAHYVPFMVPLFDEAATLQVAQAQTATLTNDWQTGDPLPVVENIEKIYRWPFRPEMQFSLFDLTIDPLEMVTTMDETTGASDTSLSFTYDLLQDPGYDPLDPLGSDRQLVFGLGYAEILALLGEDQQAQFASVDQVMAMTPLMQYQQIGAALNSLESEDYLGLQLYQNSDAGNQLAEIYGLPLLVADARPMNLNRQYHLSRFDDSVSGSIGAGYTDDYRQVRLDLFRQADVSVNILDGNGDQRAALIQETRLSQGPSIFLVDFADLAGAGFNTSNHKKFFIEVSARAVDGSFSQRIEIPGTLNERTEGQMLGQIMVHDVLIQDGSLNLSRTDVRLAGRGPELAFARTYNNQPPGRGPQPLGPGWRHNYQLQLTAHTSTDYDGSPVPNWVASLKGDFFRPSQIPEPNDQWNAVSANGTTFKLQDGAWYAQRGRHGSLSLVGGEYVFTAKDGTKYYYDAPLRVEKVYQGQSPYSTLHTSQSLVTRIGLDPAALLIPNDQPPAERTTSEMPGPSPVKRIEDRNGNSLTFTYNIYSELTAITDAVGRSLNLEYEMFGLKDRRLTKATGPDGIEIIFTYDDNGLLQSVQRAARSESYTYAIESPGVLGAQYNLTAVTDANDHTIQYEYYTDGELGGALAGAITAIHDYDVVKRVIYPDTNDAHFAYTAVTDNKRTVTDLRGNDTTYYLNYYGNPIHTVEPLGKETFMTWSIDESKNDNVMTSRTDGRGLTTSYEHDAKGNITEETDPYQHTIYTTWDQNFSVPLTRTDRKLVDQSWSYDGRGNMLTFEDGDHKTFNYTYYATGERHTATDPRQNTTTYTYDAYGNPDTVTGAEGSVTDYDYDIRGRKVREEDPNHNPTTYAYDELDQLTQVTYANLSAYNLPAGSSRVETMTYDPVGNLKTKTDRLGLTLTYTYTVRNQVESITRSAGGAKHFAYDENGNLTSETDWKNVATTHGYDALNRRTSTTNRLHHPMAMGYDLNDNLTSRTDFEGHTTTYIYDDLNRVIEIHQPDLNGQQVVTLRTYYDEADPDKNLHTETDPEGNVTTYAYNGRYLRTSRIDALTHEHTWAYDDAGNLETETDEENNTTRHVYDKQNRLIDTYRSLSGSEIRIAHNDYDAAGNLRYVTDANGHTAETRYDGWNRAYLTIDAENNQTMAYLDGAGNKTYEKDADGHERTWDYDPRGWLTTYTDGEDNPTGYGYDDNGNVETVTYANNAVTRTTYDAEDREATVTEAYGSPVARTHRVLSRDKNGNPLQVQDFNGNTTTTTYNALNLVARIYDPAPFNANYIEKTYYRTGKLKSERNRRGHDTDYEYDALNRVIKVTDALNQSVDTTYDNVGNVKTVTDKRRIVTENFYNDLYRLVRTEKAGTRLVTNEYDNAGNLTAVIDAENHRTEHSYYDNNRKKQTTFADTTTNGFVYDGVGNLLTLTDERGQETTYTYDNENRQRTVTFANETTEFEYDVMGNKTAEIRPLGNRRAFAYDLLNRLIRVTDDPAGLALATRYEYDANANLRRQYDARDNQVEYTYDALNRKTAHIQHKASGDLTVTYDTYDAEGNLTQMTDPMGRVFGYTYDELNRQTHSSAPDIDSPYHQTVEVATGYDENNNIVSVIENKIDESNASFTDETVNTYDNFDRLETSTQRGLLTSYTYDANGNRTGVTTPAGTTTYTYDHRNRLETAVADGTTTYAYRDDGLKESVTYPNGTKAAYTYSPANRIATITHSRTSNGSVISSYSYTYDANGNRTQQIELQDGVSETTTYNYDTLDRLSDFTVAGADTTVTAYTYEAYNRKTETVTANGTVTKNRSYTYDATDWLTVIDDTTDTVSPYTIAYTYDNNGNTLSKSDSSLTNQDQTFAYDAFNRLVEARRGPSGSQTTLGRYDYNAAGLRVRHRLSERGDVDYFYDDNAVIEEHNATDDSLLAHYRYADRLISLDTGAGKQYYHHDALGSTVNLTTTTAAVQVSYRLDPWGHIRDQVGTSVNRQIFTGQEHDENTGLIYFGARYYDPDTARFLTQDSYLGESGTPPSLHRYLYAYSNPTVYVDLYGHKTRLSNWMLTGSATLSAQEERAVREEYLEYARSQEGPMNNEYFSGASTAAALVGVVQVFENAFYFGYDLARGAVHEDYNDNSVVQLKEAIDQHGGGVSGFAKLTVENVGNSIEAVSEGDMVAFGELGISTYMMAESVANIGLGEARIPLPPAPAVAVTTTGETAITLTEQGVMVVPVVEGAVQAVGSMGAPVTLMSGKPENSDDSSGSNRRTPEENKKARNKYKNNKKKARKAYEERTGQDWPVDENGNPWPGEHDPPLKEGGDPMNVTPRDPGGPDPHNIPGPDGLTDYQRWGAEGTPAREANKLKGK